MKLRLILAGVVLVGCTVNVEVPTFLALVDETAVAGCIDGSREMSGFPSPDMVILDVYRYGSDDFTRTETGGRACTRCATGEADCERIARRCVCGPSFSDFDGLTEHFRQLAVEGLSADAPLCVRVTALSQGDVGELRDCTAEPTCATVELPTEASMCMMGGPVFLGTDGVGLVSNLSCRILDTLTLNCRSASCDCSLDDVPRACFADQTRPECQTGCALEFRLGCLRGGPGCTIATTGALTVDECARF